MQISHHVILKKIEEKVIEAKNSSSQSKIREHMQAIKTLTELILEDTKDSYVESSDVQKSLTSIQATPQIPISNKPAMSLSENKIEMEDGANGDSIFDF